MKTIRELKEGLALTDPEVDEIIETLLTEGLMERHQFDGRTYYTITPKGEAALPGIEADCHAIRAELERCNSGGSEMAN